MVQTRSETKRIFDKSVIGYTYGFLDDGTSVSVEIISKQGDTECYNYNGNILVSAVNFNVNAIKGITNGSKMKRFSSAKITSYVNIPAPNMLNGTMMNLLVSYGENYGSIIYFDRKH
jgi:hypothetical protein